MLQKNHLRHIIEGVDDDQTQSNKKDNSGRNHISGNQKAHPRHDHEYSSRQVYIEQIWWDTSWKSDFQAIHWVIAWKETWNILGVKNME